MIKDGQAAISYSYRKGKVGLDQNFAHNIICFRENHFDGYEMAVSWGIFEIHICPHPLSPTSFFLSITIEILIKNGRFSGHVIKDFITFEPNNLLKPPVDCMIKFQACRQSSSPLAIQVNYVYTSACRIDQETKRYYYYKTEKS